MRLAHDIDSDRDNVADATAARSRRNPFPSARAERWTEALTPAGAARLALMLDVAIAAPLLGRPVVRIA